MPAALLAGREIMTKTYSHFIVATIGMICSLSCVQQPSQPTVERATKNIRTELSEALDDATVSFEDVLALFSEYADTLYRVVRDSDFDDTATRVEAIGLAKEAMSSCIEYMLKMLDYQYDFKLVRKYLDVTKTWIVSCSGDSEIWRKEVIIASGRGTEREHIEIVSIDVVPGDGGGARLVLPAGNPDDSPVVLFYNHDIEGADLLYGDNEGPLLSPTSYEVSDSLRTYYFKGGMFYRLMNWHDCMLIRYPDGFGGMDSAVVELDILHTQTAVI